jgi:hypothetical protein
MSQRYGILCVLLFLVVLILGYENYETWSSPGALVFKKEGDKKWEGRPEPPPGVLTPKETPPRQSFDVIAEKNIFNPDRKEFSIQATPGISKSITRPPIILYGVVIAGDYQMASIVNPGRPLHKGEREIKTITIGESVGEYKLTKIMPDRIVLEGGEDSFEILLYDPRSPKKRMEVKTPSLSPTVTSAVPSAPSPEVKPMIPPAAVGSPGATPPAPSPRPVIPTATPRPPGPQPEGGYQSPNPSPAETVPPSATDPGLWRGRRPPYPVRPPG